MLDQRGKGSLRGVGADVELVDDQIVDRQTGPVSSLQGNARGSTTSEGPWTPSGWNREAGSGYDWPPIEPVLVAGSRGQSRDEPLVQPLVASDQRMMRSALLTVDLDLDRRCRGRPDRKVDASVLDRRSQIGMAQTESSRSSQR